ncbi:MAG: hypothetical protein ACK6C3_14695 [Gemmatimonadota bacterium]
MRVSRFPPGRLIAGRCAAALVIAAPLVAAPRVAAPLVAQAPRDIRGHVEISRAAGPVPAAGVWVVLHRVAPDRAGPLDSVRTDRDGHFAFRPRLAADDSALVFVSASHHGIAYFSAPGRGPRVAAAEAEIVAFDTSSAGPPIVVRGRHVIVQRGGGGDRRTVVEVYDLENTGPTTRVAPGDGATATLPLPEAAESPRAAQGDVAAEAMRFGPRQVEVLAPIAPGLRQASVSYGVPLSDFPLALAVPTRTAVLEVLAEDTSATVRGADFGEPTVVTIEGRRFRRWTAQDVAAGSTVTIGGIGGTTVPAWPVALLVLMVVALVGVGLMAHRTQQASVRLPTLGRVGLGGLSAARGDAAERLARRIAALDAAFRARTAPDDAARADYERERAELKAELSQLLAGGAPRP